tara:strand:+ start:1822 stop:2481 length:660 start_codon:yes stop_codon:yes gene_type:complete
MARLIPQVTPAEIVNPNESMLAKSLISQLDSSVEVYHSFKCDDNLLNSEQISTESRGLTRYRDAADQIVIIDPANGMLLLDLKGGSLSYLEEADCWEQVFDNGRVRRMNKSPFDQLSRKMCALMEKMGKIKPFSEMERLPFACGYALVSPHSNKENIAFPMGTHLELLWDAAKCKDLKRSIQSVFDLWRRDFHVPLGTTEMEGVRKVLLSYLGLLPDGG